MSPLAYRLASVAVAALSAAAGFVILPAAQTHRDLSVDNENVELSDVVKKQFALQRDALRAGVRLAVRETTDWRVDPEFLSQLATDEQGSRLTLKVQCAEGARSVQLSKTRSEVGDAEVTKASDIYAEALRGTLRSGWLLTERDGHKAFYGVRRLSGHGWSELDAAPAEDATVSLWKTYPDMALDCAKAQVAEGAFDKALAIAGPGSISAVTFAPNAQQPSSGLMVFSDYFGKLGAVTVSADAQAAATTVEFAYDYGDDVAKAGATFLKAKADLASHFKQTSHRYQRQGVGNELTRNRYELDHGGQLTFELAKSASGTWRINFAVTLPQAEAVKMSSPPVEVVDETAAPAADAAASAPAAPSPNAPQPAPAVAQKPV